VTGVLIPILNILYQKVARSLTNWENHRLDVDYDDSLVIKAEGLLRTSTRPTLNLECPPPPTLQASV